jgi:hypothetical protein
VEGKGVAGGLRVFRIRLAGGSESVSSMTNGEV